MRETISYTVEFRWQLKEKYWYKWSTCKRLYNTRTGREIKKTINGGSVGYWISRKFISLNKLKDHLEVIQNIEVPF